MLESKVAELAVKAVLEKQKRKFVTQQKVFVSKNKYFIADFIVETTIGQIYFEVKNRNKSSSKKPFLGAIKKAQKSKLKILFVLAGENTYGSLFCWLKQEAAKNETVYDVVTIPTLNERLKTL